MGAAGARAPVGVADLGIVLGRVLPMLAACHGLWLCGVHGSGVLWLCGVSGLWLCGVSGLALCNFCGSLVGSAVCEVAIYELTVWNFR